MPEVPSPPLMASSSTFPPSRPSFSSILGAPPSPSPLPNFSNPPLSCNWKDLLLSQSNSGNSKEINLSYIPCKEDSVSFSEEEIALGQKEWDLSLVGHAIGKRPFYGSLLAAIKKKWMFKGQLDLLTMEGDFFLFKFTCIEDYDLVWNSGTCFLNGKPFIFKKWTSDFRPVKENFAEIPLWLKFPNLPLCCWHEMGFSKIASKVGLPLTIDALTASKSRITFARICVQVTPSSPLPDEISINLNGKVWIQPILYDWKPKACDKCQTFSHENSSCPLNPHKIVENRGRSRSRPPRPPLKKQSQNIFAPSIPTNLNTLPPPTPTLNDLNQLPILSPPTIPTPTEDPCLSEDDSDSGSDSSEENGNNPSTSSDMITRSASMQSPQNQKHKQQYPSPKTPGKQVLEALASSQNPDTPNPKNKNKKKR